MLPTLILAVVCIILLFVLYVITGGWRKYGGVRGMYKWLLSGAATQGMSAKPNVSAGSSPRRSAAGLAMAGNADETDDAVAILRDLYVEFDGRQRALEARITRLETLVADMLSREDRPTARQSVSVTASDVVVSDKIPSDVVEAEKSDEMSDGSQVKDSRRYFAILDLLDAGVSDGDIVAKLGVEPEDVAYVRTIMQSPFGNPPEPCR